MKQGVTLKSVSARGVTQVKTYVTMRVQNVLKWTLTCIFEVHDEDLPFQD